MEVVVRSERKRRSLENRRYAWTATGFVFFALLAGCVDSDGQIPTSGQSAGASAPSSVGSVSTAAAGTDFAGQVDVGGRKIYLQCKGSGSPTVVLLSGYHDNAVLWSTDEPNSPATGPAVFEGVARTHRVCAYDRPGTLDYTQSPPLITTRSTSVPMPRTAADVVSELHSLLRAAHVPGPFLLVAHSLGGLFARLYTQTFPADVVGLVLVDTFPTQMPALMGGRWPAYDRLLNQPGTDQDRKAGFEVIDINASIKQLADAAPLKSDMPVVVLSKTLTFALPQGDLGFTDQQLEAAWVAGQNDLPAIAANTPHIWATGSDHYVQIRDPDLVVSSIQLISARSAR